MEAKLTGALAAAAALMLATLAPRAIGGESAPRPFDPPAEAHAVDSPLDLALPLSTLGDDKGEQIADAFRLDSTDVLPPPRPVRRDGGVQQASTAPVAERDGQLLSLFAEAERMAGRPRTVGDLTDLIERCERVAVAERERASEEDDDRGARAVDRLASWAYNRRGELHIEAGDPRSAFADFQHALLLDKTNWAAFLNRGVTLAQHGQPREALRDFDHAIELNPRLGAALHNRAEVRSELGDYAKAVGDYTSAIAAGEGSAAVYAGRGFANAQLGRFGAAASDYNEALRLAPGDAETFALRGSLYAQAGHFEQAISDFNAALAIDPRNAFTYRSVAWLLATCPDARFRDASKALAAAQRARRFGHPSDPLLLDALAAAHASAGRFDDAVRFGQQALLVAPERLRGALGERLAGYRRGTPYREPRVATSVEGGETRRMQAVR